jgi:prepilin-type N-terminal cleavage/methylation domain-containing protein
MPITLVMPYTECKTSNHHAAFTLVELAIVIVIIGLLVGGVLQGQELIRQAKYRATMKEIESYRASMATFLGKYDCLPGDCAQGSKFFGSDCGTNSIIASNNANGCNGDGNKSLTYAEGQLFWKHLSLAKLIKGSFTSGYVNVVRANINIPTSSIANNAGISVTHSQGDPSDSTPCGYSYCDLNDANLRGGVLGRNVFNIGNPNNATIIVRGGVMSPVEAYEFDMKFDDGLYHAGRISAGFGYLPDNVGFNSCGNTTTNLYGINSVNKDVVGCRMIFDTGF